MAFQPIHLGLYFSQDQLENAREKRTESDVLQGAWQWLLAQPGDVLREEKPADEDGEPQQIRKPLLEGISAAMQDALRYRFAQDRSSGTRAAQLLQSGAGLRDRDTLLNTLMYVVGTAQIAELISDHPQFAAARPAWLQQFAAYADTLCAVAGDDPLAAWWQMTLHVVAAVMLEDEQRLHSGAALFRTALKEQVRPDGYIKFATEGNDGQNFWRHVLAVAALTLTAEAATQAGVDLWSVEVRDVGINTAVTYLVYYYFYPDKWRWDEGLTAEDTRRIFADYGAWLEIATSRANPRGVELLLEQQRPLFSPFMGGLTTLSHSTTIQRKRFSWLFGR